MPTSPRTPRQRCHSEPVTDVTGVGIRIPRPLPLPLGEVAERSEDGEGKQKRTASGRFFSLSINLSCHSEEHPKGTCFAARSDVGIRNLLVANSQKSVKIVRFGNRLPRQSADWRGNDRLFRQPVSTRSVDGGIVVSG